MHRIDRIVSEYSAERFLEEAKKLISAGYKPVGKVTTLLLNPNRGKRLYRQVFTPLR
jgi:hypothetical protein